MHYLGQSKVRSRIAQYTIQVELQESSKPQRSPVRKPHSNIADPLDISGWAEDNMRNKIKSIVTTLQWGNLGERIHIKLSLLSNLYTFLQHKEIIIYGHT